MSIRASDCFGLFYFALEFDKRGFLSWQFIFSLQL